MKLFLLVFICFLLSNGPTYGQTLVEDANLSESSAGPDNIFTEKINIISNSKKIFILTNNNQLLNVGDFISLALGEDLAARAVVAKIHQDQVGIKILKIYSLFQWSKLRRGLEVKIVRGDDSLFGKKTTPAPEESSVDKIMSEEDLFSKDVVIEDEIAIFEESKKRHIKPDNLIGVSGAFLDAPEVESKGGVARATEFGFSWAYQFSDNYFFEGLYSRAMLGNYPASGIQTLANHITARVKYNIKGPLFTFFMPYIGFHSYSISSPDAGNSTNQIQNDEELDAIDSLKKSGPIFGVTALRRLVPGWFVKADIGSDIISLGFAIEF